MNRFRSFANIYDPFLQNFYSAILFYFELTFGAFVRYRAKSSEFSAPGDIMVVIVSFFANVMMIAFLTAYLMEFYKRHADRAAYNILWSQYTKIKEFKKTKASAVLYLPIYFNVVAIVFWPLAYLFFKTPFSNFVKRVDHFFLIFPLVAIKFFLTKIYKIGIFYFKIAKSILKRFLLKDILKSILWLILWLLFGPIILVCLSFLDFAGLMFVVFGNTHIDPEVTFRPSLTVMTSDILLEEFYSINSKLDFIMTKLKKHNYVQFHLFLLEVADLDKPSKQTVTKNFTKQRISSRHKSIGATPDNPFLSIYKNRENQVFNQFIEGFAGVEPQKKKKYIDAQFVYRFLKANFSLKNFELLKNYSYENIKQAIFTSVLNDDKKQIQKLIEEVNTLIEEIDDQIDVFNTKKLGDRDKKIKYVPD